MPETRSGGFHPDPKRAPRKMSRTRLITSVAVVALIVTEVLLTLAQMTFFHHG